LIKKEDSGKKPLSIPKRKLSVTEIAVTALVVVIIVGGITASYIALKPGAPSPSPTATTSPSPTFSPTPTPSSTPTPTPSPTPTPTPTPVNETHTVDWTTMASYTTDFWNITISNPYTITLNDSMTVSSGEQWLTITAQSNTTTVWSVQFINSTCFRYSNFNDYGFLNCDNGIAYVTVNATSITYAGTSSYTSSPSGVTFSSISQIQTENGDGLFNGGKLIIDVN
jgi:hypothetical protein